MKRNLAVLSSVVLSFSLLVTSFAFSTGVIPVHAGPITNSAGKILPSNTVIAPNNPNIFYSPENWFFSGSSFSRSSTPGAYFKVGFTGTTVSLLIDTSGMSSNYPKLAYSIDGGALEHVTLTSATIYNLTPTPLSSGTHQLAVYTDGIYFNDRWDTPVDQLKLTNIYLDNHATTVAPTLKPKRFVVFGDSITEGSGELGPTDAVADEQWTTTWDKLLADDLHAEIGAIGYRTEGYEQAGQGNVPNLLDSWNLLKAGVSRSFSPEPDYVMILHGTNGVTSQSDVTTMIQNLRSVYPDAVIFIGVPFNQTAKSTITAAVQSQSDRKVFLVDLGSTGASTVTANSYDGTHPNVAGDSLLAAQLYPLLSADISSVTPPAISSVSAGSLSNTGATITWTTDKSADSKVVYGTSASYGSQSTLNPTLVTSHAVTLSGLSPGTTYHYVVVSEDASSNQATSTDYVFETSGTKCLAVSPWWRMSAMRMAPTRCKN